MTEINLEVLLELEVQVWEALRTGNVKADRRLLHKNFLGVYSSGFANASDHCGQLIDGPSITQYHISDARFIPLGTSSALLCYYAEFARCTKNQPGAPQEILEGMYVSSIWRRSESGWGNIFSQDTPTQIPQGQREGKVTG